MEPVRLLDLGSVSPVRSQTVYHAVAYAMGSRDSGAIVLVSPTDPYVCIGYHQILEHEVDEAYCHAHGLPILRREVGGGAVYLDDGQVFVQWIFHRDRLPSSLEQRFHLYIRPLVETYQALGIQAYHRPINDIQVAGRKIGGTGAASIGVSEVMVGSLMFDFNFEAMARVLKVPSEKMRDKVYTSLQEYMTTMARELGQAPDREAVKALYVQKCQAALGVDVVPGTLTEREEVVARELDQRFVSHEWLYQKKGLQQPGIKINADIRLVEAAHKAQGGLIRVIARLREGRIDDLAISGDFTVLPAFAVGEMERSLRGLALEREQLLTSVEETYGKLGIQSPGVAPDDIAEAVLRVGG